MKGYYVCNKETDKHIWIYIATELQMEPPDSLTCTCGKYTWKENKDNIIQIPSERLEILYD